MKSAFIVFAFVIFLSACNQPKQVAVVPKTFEAKQLIALMKAPQSVAKETIAEIVGIEPAKIQVYNEDFSSDVSKRTVLFSWPNGAKKAIKTAAGKEISINEFSSIGIGFLRKITKEDFQKNFEGQKGVQEEINRITKDATIDADLAIAEAKNLAENARKQQFEPLESIGELAYWESPVNALHIFVKGISFTITTNLSGEETSKEKAIELAQLVFNNSLKIAK